MLVENERVDGRIKQRVPDRLFAGGSDGAAERWLRQQAITGIKDLSLHPRRSQVPAWASGCSNRSASSAYASWPSAA